MIKARVFYGYDVCDAELDFPKENFDLIKDSQPDREVLIRGFDDFGLQKKFRVKIKLLELCTV